MKKPLSYKPEYFSKTAFVIGTTALGCLVTTWLMQLWFSELFLSH